MGVNKQKEKRDLKLTSELGDYFYLSKVNCTFDLVKEWFNELYFNIHVQGSKSHIWQSGIL